MNKNERKRLTDRTILILNGLLTTTGNRMAGQNGEPGGIPVVVPDQTARDIRAIARDVLTHGARKAVLGAPITTVAESNDRVVMEQHPNWDGPRYAKPPAPSVVKADPGLMA